METPDPDRRGGAPFLPNRPGRLIWALLASLLAACGEPPSPRESFAAYLDHLSAGRLEAAFESLSRASRATLEEMETRWRSGATGPWIPAEEAPPPGRPGLAIFRRLIEGPGAASYPEFPQGVLDRIREHRQSGSEAELEVGSPGSRRVLLVLEDGEWRIQLEFR